LGNFYKFTFNIPKPNVNQNHNSLFMRKALFFLLACFVMYNSFAQDENIKNKVPSTYDRSSLGILFLNFEGEKNQNLLFEKVKTVVFPDKYDNNNLQSLLITPPYTRSATPADVQAAILAHLEKEKIGLQTLAKWYSRKPDGSMSLELIHERGRFSATDADFIKAQTTKRGNAALEDYGNRLVNLSYILVIDVKDIKNAKEASKTDLKGWQANVTGHLFKVAFNDEIQNAFYDAWIYDDDTKAQKDEKIKKFESLKVPFVAISKATVSVTAMQPESTTNLGMFMKPKTEDQLMQELAQKCIDDVIYRIEMNVEEFKVKTAIYDVRPLRAKIGLKEGLKTDQRFFVYEYVYNEKTKQTIPKKRGVIRAGAKSKIVDNRKVASGDMPTSKFYQVAGRKIEQGFTLQQQNDLGMELSLGYEIGEVGGVYARFDIRTGRFVGIRALFIYVEGGLALGEYPGANSIINSTTSQPTISSSDYTFLRYGGGIAKGLQFTRNIELRPYIGAGIEQATNDDFDDSYNISALYIKPGLNLALNLKHNFQIIGGLGSYAFISNATSSTDEDLGKAWDEIFKERSGLSYVVGLKVMF